MENRIGCNRWRRAKQIIPGGTQLLSKRAEMFLPDQWPSYYKKAKGVTIWDLDENQYTDMSIMGVGACILGYADDDVNRAVIEAITNGSMSTLVCPEEVDLAELLLKIHPWAGMVRYAKTGGEAMTVATRIGRAATGRDTIAFCGYHGWHDWYLAANLSNDSNLDGHLLPGLQPKGVPRCLIGSSIPFGYNRPDELERIVAEHEVGVIVMEPIRHHEPEHNFLHKVRTIADESGAVLIFDEITSGWRMNVGGIHSLYSVTPDIAVYGKAMSNGYPMASIIGKEEVMQHAQESFISSTYWTERTGLAASIETLQKLQRCNVPGHLITIGKEISEGWKAHADEYNIPIDVAGIPPLTTFSFLDDDSQLLHTIFTQEMLKQGYLASKSVYASYAHTHECVESYLDSVGTTFSILSKAMKDKTTRSLLSGSVAHEGFKRLT